MSAPRTVALADIDAVVLEIGEPLFFDVGQGVKKPKRSIGGPARGAGQKGPGRGASVQAVRAKLRALAKGAPEVMVKISGAPKGMRQLRAHLDYISRNGELELVDQEGHSYSGRDELAEVRELFELDGHPIPQDGRVRESFNIVLSMPKGTDVVGLRRAVQELAAAEFSGHTYVMALHTWDTDPDPQPSPHPHVHLAVKAKSQSDARLNPRKADLQRWRETFVRTLEANGIEAVATRRAVRLQRRPGERQSVRQMKSRGVVPSRLVRRDEAGARRDGAQRSDSAVVQGYRTIAAALRESPDPKDLRLALGLLQRFGVARSKGLGGQEQGEDRGKAADLGPKGTDIDAQRTDKPVDRDRER